MISGIQGCYFFKSTFIFSLNFRDFQYELNPKVVVEQTKFLFKNHLILQEKNTVF